MSDPTAQVEYEVIDLWRATFTRRWHMNPDVSHLNDDIGAHQGRCAVLALALFPDASRSLLMAAVTHDLAEFKVGDLSATFKDVGGDLIRQHRDLEHEVLDQMGFGIPLDSKDAKRLTFVDRLDAYLFVGLRLPHLLASNAWRVALHDLMVLAVDLGVLPTFKSLIDHITTGDEP